ncbi:hypothetical protein CEXT_796421 [Caerostris extrusa]|uniref:Uncharacterized protein n=1 Tax=Caerostris extrusa TaxID=172846 RepID=A0AAV4VHK2_CAEEX|nr:hypothetical protein CEXT_796421 [Caerostris extrusa]
MVIQSTGVNAGMVTNSYLTEEDFISDLIFHCDHNFFLRFTSGLTVGLLGCCQYHSKFFSQHKELQVELSLSDCFTTEVFVCEIYYSVEIFT